MPTISDRLFETTILEAARTMTPAGRRELLAKLREINREGQGGDLLTQALGEGRTWPGDDSYSVSGLGDSDRGLPGDGR